MSWWTSSGEDSSVPNPIRAVVVAVGWGIFLLPIFGFAIFVFLSLVAAGLYLTTNPSTVTGIVEGGVSGGVSSTLGGISSDLAMVILFAAVALIAYLAWTFFNLLKVVTFGEETVEESREQAQESVTAATETAEDISESVDEVRDE
jgi:hypothetical protein